jgi:signal transduction histidine kinase
MFSQIRLRLTALNAVVFFVILIGIGGLVYAQLHHQLFAKVDASLTERVQGFDELPEQNQPNQPNRTLFFTSKEEAASPEGNLSTIVSKKMLRLQVIDPRIFLVLWDEQGNAIPLLPNSAGQDEAVARLAESKLAGEPQTVSIGGHTYRSYAVSYPSPVTINVLLNSGLALSDLPPQVGVAEGGPVRVVTVQAVSNVDSEQNMLNNLLRLIAIGVVLGGAVTVLAGYYLANKALTPIGRAWDKQRQFVADASHELRTPLSIIQANTELVFRHPERTILEMSESIADVLHESRRMAKLTDQLLTLARTDSNQEQLQLGPVELLSLISETVRKLLPLAEAKGVELAVGPLAAGQKVERLAGELKVGQLAGELKVERMAGVPSAEVLAAERRAGLAGASSAEPESGLAEMLKAEPQAELSIRGDRERLQQLLVILLDNSLKFTPEGGTVRVSCGQRGGFAEIVVADSGIGIDEADLPRIFDRFYRGDQTRSRKDGGTGLGLAIARWIVEQHRGVIRAASRPGEGTTMTVLLRR